MGRLTIPALLAVALLSGCSGDGDATTPTPSPTTSAATPTPPAPTPPVMPEAAKAHTEAGAKEFVTYFWEVVDYAAVSREPDLIAALTGDGCIGCEGAIELVRNLADEHGTFSGATTRIAKPQASWRTPGSERRMQVTFDVITPEQIIDYPGSTPDEVYPAGTRATRFFLEPSEVGWRVVLWEPA